jgi:hypothetical protein
VVARKPVFPQLEADPFDARLVRPVKTDIPCEKREGWSASWIGPYINLRR